MTSSSFNSETSSSGSSYRQKGSQKPARLASHPRLQHDSLPMGGSKKARLSGKNHARDSKGAYTRGQSATELLLSNLDKSTDCDPMTSIFTGSSSSSIIAARMAYPVTATSKQDPAPSDFESCEWPELVVLADPSDAEGAQSKAKEQQDGGGEQLEEEEDAWVFVDEDADDDFVFCEGEEDFDCVDEEEVGEEDKVELKAKDLAIKTSYAQIAKCYSLALTQGFTSSLDILALPNKVKAGNKGTGVFFQPQQEAVDSSVEPKMKTTTTSSSSVPEKNAETLDAEWEMNKARDRASAPRMGNDDKCRDVRSSGLGGEMGWFRESDGWAIA